MALIDELKALFERDIRFATWDENVKVDESDPNKVDVRFYTDTNEYALLISADAGGETSLDATIRPRKARAGQIATRARPILPVGRSRLDARTWRRLMSAIVGAELVRVQRREPTEAVAESGKVSKGSARAR